MNQSHLRYHLRTVRPEENHFTDLGFVLLCAASPESREERIAQAKKLWKELRGKVKLIQCWRRSLVQRSGYWDRMFWQICRDSVELSAHLVGIRLAIAIHALTGASQCHRVDAPLRKVLQVIRLSEMPESPHRESIARRGSLLL